MTSVPIRVSNGQDAPYLSVVIPVYNEEESIVDLHNEVVDALRNEPYGVEVIYVDDGSRDGSLQILEQIVRTRCPLRVRVLKFSRNFGQTAAMGAGFDAAEGTVVIPMDADRQNNPHDIPRLVARLNEGYDVVSGWRKNRKDKAISRKLPSKVANWIIGQVSGVKLHDYGCTLKAYRGSMLRQLHLYGEMHRFIPLYLAQHGAKVTEEVVDHRARERGVSKYGSRRIVKVFVDLFLIRFMWRYFNRPMHFFGQTAVLFFALAFVSFMLMVLFKYGAFRIIGIDYQASFVQTPLPALAGTFIIGGVMSIFFGILAEVMMRMNYELRGLTPYKVELTMDSRA